jgi:hypothetical protein
VCPYIDRSDPRCSAHWTVQNIIRAFAHCTDRYFDCPVYLQLVDDKPAHDQAPAAPYLAAAS